MPVRPGRQDGSLERRVPHFFPEHAGHVHPGEPYRDNLLRFYRGRLSRELANIERYIAEGIERHRTQTRPFVFSHLGRRLRVASQATGDGYRVRIWQDIAPEQAAPAHGALWADFPSTCSTSSLTAPWCWTARTGSSPPMTSSCNSTTCRRRNSSVIDLTFAEVVRGVPEGRPQEGRAAGRRRSTTCVLPAHRSRSVCRAGAGGG